MMDFDEDITETVESSLKSYAVKSRGVGSSSPIISQETLKTVV